MNILITGGLGFIGSHLVEALASEGHRLVILDDLSTGRREHAPKGSEIIIDDVARTGVFDTIIGKVDACYHLAAIASVERSREEWLRTHQVNNSGLVNLFDAIVRSKKTIPVVFASSAAVYGDNSELPLSETSAICPISSYGADKLSCEFSGRAAAHTHDIPNIGLRFFNVFGPRQDPASPYSGVISIFARRVLDKQPLTIYGDGEQSRDFIYVDDVVQALTKSMQQLQTGKERHAIYNVCTGKEITVNRLAQTLGELTNSKPAITNAAPRAGDIRHSLGTPEKAKKDFGFAANVKFADGLRSTLDWLKGTP